MRNKKQISYMIILILAVCAVMAFVDAVISPTYFVKSAVKLILFLGVPMVYAGWNKQTALLQVFRIKKNMVQPLILGGCVYALIIGAYFIIGPFFDFSNVTVALADNYGVSKDNFLSVAIYISFINSLLEEFFFRGFAFIALKKLASRRLAYLFSAATFSIYHIAIMSSWFSIALFLLLIACLFVAGLLFDWLNEKNNTIYNSWLVHMCANFAINTIGFLLFGII